MKPHLYDYNIQPVSRVIPPGETLVACGPPVDTKGYSYLRSVVLFNAVTGSLRIEWGEQEAGVMNPVAFSRLRDALVVDAVDWAKEGVSWNVIKIGPGTGRQRFIRVRLKLAEGRQTPLTPPRGAVVTFAVYMELYRPDSPMAAMYDKAVRAAAPVSRAFRGRIEGE